MMQLGWALEELCHNNIKDLSVYNNVDGPVKFVDFHSYHSLLFLQYELVMYEDSCTILPNNMG